MFNCDTELNDFYTKHVRLPKDLRDALARYRDLNVQRLKDGLTELEKQTGVPHRYPLRIENQGSYAIHTLNQCDSADYDIDVALVFDEEDVPGDAGEARSRVEAALLKKCPNFVKPPQARKNAVTVWYADNYHIDFAVYRRRSSWLGGEIIEHAGADGWAQRKPSDFGNWFDQQLSSKSPVTGAVGRLLGVTVEENQLRRIVRFVKCFARSRSGWALPGGIVLTTLVCETYRPNNTRDDVALHNTLIALCDRVRGSKEVLCPVPNHKSLVGSPQRQKEMQRLFDCLDTAVKKLEILRSPRCTQLQALAAWKAVFNHKYWGEQAKQLETAAATSSLWIECALARRKDGAPYATYGSGASMLPKGIHLRFKLKQTSVLPPFQIRWTVENEGDEASDASQITWTKTTSAGEPLWTSTSYRGRQKMKCEIVKNGVVVETAVHVVRIST